MITPVCRDPSALIYKRTHDPPPGKPGKRERPGMEREAASVKEEEEEIKRWGGYEMCV